MYFMVEAGVTVATRMGVLKSNVLELSARGLRFRDRTWLIVSRSPTDPTQASVARTCCQLYADGPTEAATDAEDLARTRDFILSSLSGEVRRDHLMLQGLLIEKGQRAVSGMEVMSVH